MSNTPWEAVTITWKGQELTIPPDRLLGAIAKIEEHLTFMELVDAGQRKAYPLAKLAMAFTAMLNWAGVRPYVNEREVYAELFKGSDGTSTAFNVITSLLSLMLPPDLRAKPMEAAPDPLAPPVAPAERNGSGDGSETPTSPQSGAASSRASTSGRSTPPNSGGSSKRTGP